MHSAVGKRARWIIGGLADNQMKVNEKVPTYILFFQLYLKKSPHPAYEIWRSYGKL